MYVDTQVFEESPYGYGGGCQALNIIVFPAIRVVFVVFGVLISGIAVQLEVHYLRLHAPGKCRDARGCVTAHGALVARVL